MTDALLLDRDLVLRTGRLEVPEPLPGQLAVRVDWCGVCPCDLHAARTGDGVVSWPAALGHEVAGTVVDCPGGELPVGSPVVIGPQELPRAAGPVRPGGFAGHLLASAGQAVRCPYGLEPAIAVLAGPLAAAMRAVGRVACPPRPRRAAIFGYGPAGALVHLEITRRWPEARVAVVDPGQTRRELARAFGADTPSREELAGWGAQLVADGTGEPHALEDAAAACRDGGTAVAVVAPAPGHDQVQPGDLADALAVLEADPDRCRPLITDAFLLDEAVAGLRGLVGSPPPGKVLIRP